MAEELQMQEAGQCPKKRKLRLKKGKGKKKMKVMQGSGQKVRKMDGKMKKLFRKKARDYNSDDSDNDNDIDDTREKHMKFEKTQVHIENNVDDEKSLDVEMDNDDDDGADDDDDDDDVGNDVSDDEDEITEHGIMKFSEGSMSFKKAFKKIIKRSGSDDVLGPVLSAHKNLLAKKLAEEVAAENKAKGDARKEKILLREKGRVKPNTSSDPEVSREKSLIRVATKGVVKLFNAVNKAQSSQKGLNPLRSKDAKVIQKRRKEAFFSELGKPPSGSDAKVGASRKSGDEEGPAWAPLRDNYMLTTSKLKDWDKAADEAKATNDFERQEDSSSEDDDD